MTKTTFEHCEGALLATHKLMMRVAPLVDNETYDAILGERDNILKTMQRDFCQNPATYKAKGIKL